MYVLCLVLTVCVALVNSGLYAMCGQYVGADLWWLGSHRRVGGFTRFYTYINTFHRYCITNRSILEVLPVINVGTLVILGANSLH